MGLEVIVGDDVETVGAIVAGIVSRHAPAVLGVATGSSPLPTYRELIRRGTPVTSTVTSDLRTKEHR